MISETTAIDTSLDDLLNRQFAGRVVRKDLTKLVKEGANVPVYVLEYLLGTYCATNDEEVIQEGLQTVKRILAENYVRPDEAEKVKSIIRERGSLKIIDKVTVSLNERRDVYEALLSNLGVKGVEVSSTTVKQYEKLLVGGIWTIMALEYFYEEGQRGVTVHCPGPQTNSDAQHGSRGTVRGTPSLHGGAVDRCALAFDRPRAYPLRCAGEVASALPHGASGREQLQRLRTRPPWDWEEPHLQRDQPE
jgi:hypothetical protein